MTNRAISGPSRPKFGPPFSRYLLPNATKFMFAPFSTSSMPISTPRAFRLVAMHMAPQTNITAPTVMKWAAPGGSVSRLAKVNNEFMVCIACGRLRRQRMAPAFRAGQIRGADEHDEQVHRHELEVQQVARLIGLINASAEQSHRDRGGRLLNGHVLNRCAIGRLPLGNAERRR